MFQGHLGALEVWGSVSGALRSTGGVGKCFRGIEEHWGCGEVFQEHLGALEVWGSVSGALRSTSACKEHF